MDLRKTYAADKKEAKKTGGGTAKTSNKVKCEELLELEANIQLTIQGDNFFKFAL